MHKLKRKEMNIKKVAMLMEGNLGKARKVGMNINQCGTKLSTTEDIKNDGIKRKEQ